MLLFQANFYFMKGKIKDLDCSTMEGAEKDKELESYKKEFVPILEAIFLKVEQIRKGKKSKDVWFIELDSAKWLESGRFKDWEKTEILITKTAYTPASFTKASKFYEHQDEKALAKVDDEELPLDNPEVQVYTEL